MLSSAASRLECNAICVIFRFRPMTIPDPLAVFELTRPIWEEPTAPFHETGMRRVIHDLLDPLPHVSVEPDEFGNLIARYRHGAKPARWAFAAHMDHPGWVRPPEGKPGEWTFLGGVPEAIREANKHRIRAYGDFAMWDLPVGEVRDGVLHSRACDDQGGCAVIVAMFHELERLGAEAEVYGFFTRAEEVGFVGALHLARSGSFQDQGLTVISLETSAERPPAKIGAGPIVRVGDKTSLFDTGATEEILQIARESGIGVQRCLMAGGTCEASAFQLYGLTSAGLCVALGNYHNVTPEGGLGAEYISLDDLAGLVALCREIALRTEPAGRTRVAELLKERLEKEIEEYRPYYARADV
jgi:putative aminopeptidase FrvX